MNSRNVLRTIAKLLFIFTSIIRFIRTKSLERCRFDSVAPAQSGDERNKIDIPAGNQTGRSMMNHAGQPAAARYTEQQPASKQEQQLVDRISPPSRPRPAQRSTDRPGTNQRGHRAWPNGERAPTRQATHAKRKSCGARARTHACMHAGAAGSYYYRRAAGGGGY